MKLKLYSFLALFLISTTCLRAQDYLISFTGSGASTTVATVKVENLTQGKELTMNGTDVLHLMGTITTIETLNGNESNKVVFSPNPMNDYTKMQFELPESGQTTITLYDISGKKLVQKQDLLQFGQHIYEINGLQSGMYFVKIISGRYLFSGRLLCSGSQSENMRIIYQNTSVYEGKENDLKGANAEIVMQYNTGDRLKFTGIAGNYSTVLTEIPAQNKLISFNFIPCTDAANNHYPVISIGTQTWMARNLEYLPAVSPSSAGSETEKFYYVYGYQGTNISEAKATANFQVYGVLYNYQAANNSCPAGWHLPADEEWNTLENYLIANGYNYDGTTSENKLGKALAATALWNSWILSPGAVGNTSFPQRRNMTGFTALPGGYRYNEDGTFILLHEYGYFWTSSSFSTQGYFRYLVYNYEGIYGAYNTMARGFSVRCIKNN